MATQPGQKYATLKFFSLKHAQHFKERVGSNATIKQKVKGVFSIRFKIDKTQPLSSRYITNKMKYK